MALEKKMVMELLTTLMLGHLLADFPLQTNKIAALKTKSLTTLFIHGVIHIFVTWGLLGLRWDSFALVCVIGVAHLLVDWWKPRLLQASEVSAFIIDQFVHLFCIVLATLAVQIGQHTLPHSSVPAVLLYPSLFLGFTFGGMVLYWLWTRSHSAENVNHSLLCRYGQNQLLEWEQRVGLALVCLISISIFFNSR